MPRSDLTWASTRLSASVASGPSGTGQEAIAPVTCTKGSSNQFLRSSACDGRPPASPAATKMMRMASFFISTFAFFVAAYFIKRKLEEIDIPPGMTRNLVVFVLAAFIAYGVGFLVDLVAG